MSSLLYLIALVLIIGWILGFFVYSVGGLIHILLVLAIFGFQEWKKKANEKLDSI